MSAEPHENPDNLGEVLRLDGWRVRRKVSRAIRRNRSKLARFPGAALTIASRLQPQIDERLAATPFPQLLRGALAARKDLDALLHPELGTSTPEMTMTYDDSVTLEWNGRSCRLEETIIVTCRLIDLSLQGDAREDQLTLKIRSGAGSVALKINGCDVASDEFTLCNYERVVATGDLGRVAHEG